MSVFYGPKFPSDGLVFYVDAGNTRSYPGSGNRWYDIGGTGHYMDLGSSVSYQSATGGVLRFAEDANGYARISDTYVNLSTSNNTVITWSRKLSNGNDGRVVTAYQNNWLLGHHDSTYGDYYAQGWIEGGVATSDTIWRQYTGNGNISTDVWELWINDTLRISNSGGDQGPRGFNVNNQYSQYSSAEVAMIAAWNRVLSGDEIKLVYELYRGRFGV